MAQDEPQDSAGPSSPPPPLPEGWLAQWEGVSRKWYYVQRATGKSQWDIPTEPVILTPSTTPGSIGAGPTQAPGSGRMQSLSPQSMATNPSDMDGTRGFFGSSAVKPSLSALLGSHGNSGITQIADRVLSKISKEFIPNNTSNQSPNNQSSYLSYGSGPNSSQPQVGHNPYGYSSTGQSGNYTGTAPQYYPQGQPNSQQGEVPQHSDVPHGQSGSANPSGYQQYHTPNQSVPPNQFSNMNPVPQPWQSQSSFTHDPPPYQPPVSHGQPSMSMPSQPEWQMGGRPAVPHSTKPNSNNPMAMPNQPQSPNDYQPSYQQQVPQQHPNQPPQNAYPHSQMGYDFPHPQQGTPGPMPQNLPQSSNNLAQNIQGPPHPGFQHPSPYNPNSGMIPGHSPVTGGFQNNVPMTTTNMALPPTFSQQGDLPHHSNSGTPLSHYSGNNVPNNPPTQTHAFAVELPDNQINSIRPASNMHNQPPPGQQHYGQPFPQAGVPQMPPQPLPNPTAAQLPGQEPVRHTPTDPQFVSGPWTSPPATSNHNYPPNRYNNNNNAGGGY